MGLSVLSPVILVVALLRVALFTAVFIMKGHPNFVSSKRRSRITIYLRFDRKKIRVIFF